MPEVGNLRASLSANTAQFESDMKRAKNAVRSNAKGMESSMARVKKKFNDAAIGLKAFAAAAVGASIGLAAKKNMEFSKSVSELSAITGASGKDLKFYREEAMRMGASTTFAASQVVQAFKLVASAKPELLESKEALAAVTSEVLTLAEASGLDLQSAAKALAGSLNQFGEGAEEAERYINVLAAGAKYGASEITDTAEALKNSGAVAASIGVSFEEANAAIQALGAVSIKAGEAGTGLRGVLIKLATQSRDEFNPEIVGLEHALKNLAAANLSTAEKTKLFGAETITSATALINQADAVGKLTRQLSGTNTAYEQASINVDNLDGDMKSMSSAWERAAIILGNIFDPALRASVRLLRWFGNAASSIAIALGDMGDAVGAYAAIARSALKGDLDGIKTIIAARKEQRAENERRLESIWNETEAEEALGAAREKSNKKLERSGTKPKRGSGSGVSDEEKSRRSEIARTIEALEMARNTFGLTAGELAAYELKLLGATPAQIEFAKSLAESNEMLFAAAEITESVMTPMERYKEKLQRLNDLLKEGAITEETHARAVKAAWKEISDAAKKSTDESTEFVKEAARNMQDAMADGFFSIMQGEFGDLEQSFKRTIDRMVANLLSSQLNNWLFGDLGNSGNLGGVVGDIAGSFDLGSLFSFDGGGYTGDGARAGGMDGKGGYLAMVHPKEDIIDHTKRQRSGMQVINNISISAPDGRISNESMSQLQARLGRSMQRSLARNS